MDLIEFIKELYAIVLVHRLVIVFCYLLLSWAVHIFVNRILKKLASMTSISFDDQVIMIMHLPVVLTVVGIGVLHAVALPPILAAPWDKFLPGITKSLILFIWASAGLKIFGLIAENNLTEALSRGKMGKDLLLLLKNVVRVVIVILVLLWLLSIWDINLAPIFASAGIAGIAVALAAKDTLANFFGGISIFADRTFAVGDYIILDNNDRGEVVEIGIRSTRLKTRDDVLITIPNAILANSKIINESAPIPRFRIRVPIGVAYGSNLDEVEAALLEVAERNPAVAKEPAPRVRLRAFGPSSLDYQLLCWVDDPSLKGRETHNLLRDIYNIFAARNITIPFPQQDIYIKEIQGVIPPGKN
ncbi:MAG: mechanosensitive ion channel family protein [Desulfobulbaceae bacterium]|nr:mechanosensitive ion channel family protein [Desulfobulbaceae bacterium]HIJ79816.1 mechanosensitive ion channel family protein [Deltaproteobacteria bacterium]